MTHLGGLVSALVLLSAASDVAKKVVNTPWWPAGSEKTAESVGIISHGFVFMTAMMELNETLQKTALQETFDVRDIAEAAGAGLVDLVDCFVNAPKGQGEQVKDALLSALPAAVQASPPALTVVEMPGEYQFVNNSIMCIGNIPDGTSKRSTWRHGGIYGVSARGLLFIQGSVADLPGDAFSETESIVTQMLSGAPHLLDCTAFVPKIEDAPAVRLAMQKVLKSSVQPAFTVLQAPVPAERSVLLRCTADLAAAPRSTATGVVLTDRFVFTSAQLDRNSTGVAALRSLETLLTPLKLSLKEVVSCSFYVQDQQKMLDLFAGFFEVFNQENPPPPTRGEYQAQSECAECQVAAKCIVATTQSMVLV